MHVGTFNIELTDLCYIHFKCVLFLQLQVGVEFEANTRMQDTTTSFGYQLDLPKANLLFKGKYCTQVVTISKKITKKRKQTFSFQNSSLLFSSAGTVDSNWVVGATLEKKLLPLPLTLALGAFLNHRKNKFQCGFGVTIG